jgi:hypothetical protein
MPTLILTPRFTDDAQSLWRAAIRLGWQVQRLPTWRVPPELLAVQEPVLYLEGLFGPTLAQEFGLALLEPPIDWLATLPHEYKKRSVTLTTLGQARQNAAPAFVKPPNEKSFPAQVYTGKDLPTDFPDDTPVLVAQPVVWEKEFRVFILDRKPRTISVYLRNGEIQREAGFAQTDEETNQALAFLQTLLNDSRVELPKACVIDVGVIAGQGWAVVEQNAAWGSGIYGCDPEQVLQVIQHAATPISQKP